MSGSRLSSMPAPGPSRNRGPAAAPANRAAILDAARRVFAEQGYRAPFSAIAKTAGVGQAVLYRHFPDRLELAFAVFADNFAELERLATTIEGPGCFHVVWRRIVEYTLESSAIVEMVIDARLQLPDALGSARLEHLVEAPLARAQAAGLVHPDWTPHDVLLLQHMVYGVIIAQPSPAEARDAVRRALHLIDPRLSEGAG